ATGGSAVGEKCRGGACTGTLESSVFDDYVCNRCGTIVNASITRRLGGTACTTPCTGTMQRTATVQANWLRRQVSGGNTVEATYRCDNCGRTDQAFEQAGAGAANVACGLVCPRRGTMQASGAPTAQEIAGPSAALPLASWGGPLGSLFLDTREGPRTFWSHEIGHHKHLEHAGDVISTPAQHDRAANAGTLGATPRGANHHEWDRDCIMSYINSETAFRLTATDDDRGYFCGKCLLKLRGWKVEGLADPAGNLIGP
ncbi:MAG TPA: hypothetical protein VK636_00175, partial [Gemmatimonadaceae bacterium]|nr:hypothetical protein [Gemmatimonadaceae bacterium]